MFDLKNIHVWCVIYLAIVGWFILYKELKLIHSILNKV